MKEQAEQGILKKSRLDSGSSECKRRGLGAYMHYLRNKRELLQLERQKEKMIMNWKGTEGQMMEDLN